MKFLRLFLLALILISSHAFSASPKMTEDTLIFSYTNPSARDVKLISSIDGYQTLMVMRKNPDGVWEVRLDLTRPEFQLKPGRYFYKFIVDHIHTPDPENPDTETDPFAGEISVFDIQAPLIAFDKSPQKIGPRTYRFYFKTTSSWDRIQEIQFAGSFNDWQPYEYFLTRLNKNIWYLDFTFTRPGIYHYQYIINGKWVNDPFNTRIGNTQTGAVYSIVEVEN